MLKKPVHGLFNHGATKASFCRASQNQELILLAHPWARVLDVEEARPWAFQPRRNKSVVLSCLTKSGADFARPSMGSG